MAFIVFLLALIIYVQASWLREDQVLKKQESELISIDVYFNKLLRSQMVGSSYSLWGSGISQSMKSSIISLINQGQAYNGSDYEKQATYISTGLSKLDQGTWNVILISDMKLKSSGDQYMRGFTTSLWVLEQKYAVLFEECQSMSRLSHIIAKSGAPTRKYVSSYSSSTNMGNEDLNVVTNTLKAVASYSTSLYSVCSDVRQRLEAWNKQRWSCVVTDFYYNSLHINAYGVIYNYYPYSYATFQQSFKLKDGNLTNFVLWQQ